MADCPLQAVPCSFADIGCLYKVSILMVSARVKKTNEGISGVKERSRRSLRGVKGVK